jgi:hypothetical protein
LEYFYVSHFFVPKMHRRGHLKEPVEPVKENIQTWVKAGAASLAVGSKLFTPSVLGGRENESLGQLVSDCLLWAKEARLAK